MGRALILVIFMAAAQAATPMGAYVDRVRDLVLAHRGSVARLVAPATRSAQALIAGGAFYLGGSHQGWIYEGIGRAGGLMRADAVPAIDLVQPGDVVWVSYSAGTYSDTLRTVAELEQKKCVVIALGPQLALGPPAFVNWIDSFTSPDADENLTLMGNVLSLWSLTAEMVAAAARGEKTLALWQSVAAPGGAARNALYEGLMFHAAPPQTAAVGAEVLGNAYLDYIDDMLGRIVSRELPKLVQAGEEIAHRRATSGPVTLLANSHLMVTVGSSVQPWFEYVADNRLLSNALSRSGFLVYVGYAGMDATVWRTSRRAGAKAVWILGQVPNQADFAYYGDVVVNQHWLLGDCAVAVPGYDVRILPPSGIAQLFLYEILRRAADGP